MPGFSTLFLPNTNPAQYTANDNVSQDASKLVYPIQFQEAIVFSCNENENDQNKNHPFMAPPNENRYAEPITNPSSRSTVVMTLCLEIEQAFVEY